MTTRKKYPKEFELDAMSLVLEQEYIKAEAPQSLGINPHMIIRWIQEHQADHSKISHPYQLGYTYHKFCNTKPHNQKVHKTHAVYKSVEHYHYLK